MTKGHCPPPLEKPPCLLSNAETAEAGCGRKKLFDDLGGAEGACLLNSSCFTPSWLPWLGVARLGSACSGALPSHTQAAPKAACACLAAVQA